MSRYSVFLVVVSLALITALAGAQGVAVAQYITFDSATPGPMTEGTVLALVSPERSTIVEEVLVYNPPTGLNDGPEIATASLASPMQGGQVLACDPGNSNDEGIWVDLNAAYPLGDVTVEAMFFTSDVSPTRAGSQNPTLGLQYIVSTEVPGGSAQFFQGQLRIVATAGSGVGNLQWNAGRPDGSGEATIQTPIVANTWYHAAGTLDYNDADPANSTMEFFLSAGDPINTATDSIGTAAINMDNANVTTAWGSPFSPTIGPDSTTQPRYMVGCSPSNSINGIDRRGLLGEIDAVAVSAQVGEVYLPDAPPIPPVTAADAWNLYR